MSLSSVTQFPGYQPSRGHLSPTGYSSAQVKHCSKTVTCFPGILGLWATAHQCLEGARGHLAIRNQGDPSLCCPQVIYMARNPKDLVVSYYQFHRSLRTMSYRGTFQEFCRRFMNDKCKFQRVRVLYPVTTSQCWFPGGCNGPSPAPLQAHCAHGA